MKTDLNQFSIQDSHIFLFHDLNVYNPNLKKKFIHFYFKVLGILSQGYQNF